MRLLSIILGLLILFTLSVPSLFAAEDSRFKADAVTPFVTMVYDDKGLWGGTGMGTTHQERPAYQAKKRISTSCVPEEKWRSIREARIRILFFIQDISHMGTSPNGLDESFEVIVNGHVHTYSTAEGFPAKAIASDKLKWEWTDFIVPLSDLNHGENEIIVKKAPSPGNKNDDYIYVGIDNSVHNGHSFMSEDSGLTWQSNKLNMINATGEYMVRLLLLEEQGLVQKALWQSGSAAEPTDLRDSLLTYAVWDKDRQRYDLDLEPSLLSCRREATASVAYSGGGTPTVDWIDEAGTKMTAVTQSNQGTMTSTVRYGYLRPAKLVLATQPVGLVENPGFERVSGVRPASWITGESSEEQTPIIADSAVAHSGKRSLCIRHAHQNYSWAKMVFPVKPHTQYTASVWMKTESVVATEGSQAAKMVVARGRGGDTFVGTPSLTGSCDWTKQSFRFDTGELKEVNIILYLHNASGIAWFDDVSVTEGTDEAKTASTPDERIEIKSAAFTYVPSFLPVLRNDMTPVISPPAGRTIAREPRCVISPRNVTFENAHLSCTFGIKGEFALTNFQVNAAGRNVLREPKESHLFLVEVGERQYAARNFTIRKLSPLPAPRKGAVLDLFLPEYKLGAELTIWIGTEPELLLSLKIVNEGNKPIDFKVAFPHLGGLGISDRPADDYYLFPFHGGIINDAPVRLRGSYGDHTCWWQMIDLFSPERGSGLYLRCADTEGMFKFLSLSKGLDFAYASMDSADGVDPALHLGYPFSASDHTAMTIEYLRRTRKAGDSFVVPSAAIGVHEGDWHTAMSRYSKWAHTVWQWRDFPSRMHNVWNITAPGWSKDGMLFRKGRFITDFMRRGVDFAELMSYWEWADTAMWNIPFDQMKEKLGSQLVDMMSSYITKDPVTGKTKFMQNWGDYDYNSSFGGLPALRKYIADIKATGIMPTFYVAGYLACATTRAGQKYGLQYGIMPLWPSPSSPVAPKGYLDSYGVFNMCPDTEAWSEYIAQTLKRLAVDTRIEGVRLDEFGYAKPACISDKHTHLFAEPGHNEHLRAQVNMYRKIRQAVDPIDPKFAMAAEHFGYDCLARYMDWALDYDVRYNPDTVRKVPMTLFRFYFPECKTAEFNDGDPMMPEYRLFNAWAVMHPNGPEIYYLTLLENGDAFDSDDIEPLVRTLKRQLYAHRFSSSGKRIYTFFNASGRDVDGAILPSENLRGQHWVNLLSGEDLALVQVGSKTAVAMAVENNKAACVARLPVLLKITTSARSLKVDISVSGKQLFLILSSLDGKEWVRIAATQGKNEIRLDGLELLKNQRYLVKLLEGKYLRDMTSFVM